MYETAAIQQMNPFVAAETPPQRRHSQVLLDCTPQTCVSGLRAKVIGTRQPELAVHAELFKPKTMELLAKLHVPATLAHAAALGETCIEFTKGTVTLHPPVLDGLTWVKTQCHLAGPGSRTQEVAVYEAKPVDEPSWFMLAARPRATSQGHRAGFNWYTRNREVLNNILEQLRHGELWCEPI